MLGVQSLALGQVQDGTRMRYEKETTTPTSHARCVRRWNLAGIPQCYNAGPCAVNTYTDPTFSSAHLMATVGSQVGCPPTLYRPRRLTDPRAQ